MAEQDRPLTGRHLKDLEAAWVAIANAVEAAWGNPEWREAAERWRDQRWHRALHDRHMDGLTATIQFSDADPIVTCECGHRSFGDSINDAVLAWAAHVTATPTCREKL